MLTFNCNIDNQQRDISFHEYPSFQQLSDAIARQFELSQTTCIKFVDDEGDLITISDDRELEEALELCQELGQDLIRLFIVPFEEDDETSDYQSSSDEVHEGLLAKIAAIAQDQVSRELIPRFAATLANSVANGDSVSVAIDSFVDKYPEAKEWELIEYVGTDDRMQAFLGRVDQWLAELDEDSRLALSFQIPIVINRLTLKFSDVRRRKFHGKHRQSDSEDVNQEEDSDHPRHEHPHRGRRGRGRGRGRHGKHGRRGKCRRGPHMGKGRPHLRVRQFEFGDLHLVDVIMHLLFESESEPYKHLIKCAECGVEPIEGRRFMCMVCEDVNLCEACEAQGNHPENHPLVMMKTVVDKSLTVNSGLKEVRRMYHPLKLKENKKKHKRGGHGKKGKKKKGRKHDRRHKH